MSLVKLRLTETVEESRGPESLLGLLMACHTRIRRFARLAFTLGARPSLPRAEVTEAAEQCLRYFAEALPLHVRDEEDSLWPRLAGRSPALDASMAQMRAQHFGHTVRLEVLMDALKAVQNRPNNPLLHRQLELAASALETDLEEHLRLEESELFPLLEEALSEDLRQLIILELRSRRSRS